MFKITVCLIILLTIASRLFAQPDVGANPFLNDANGRPLYLRSNYTADGSPFLFDDYLPATLVTADGRTYNNVAAKINLVDKDVYYQLPDGKEMVSTTPITQVVFRNVPALIPGVDSILLIAANGAVNAKGAAAYIVYAKGRISLLKRININYKDHQEYGNMNVIRTFTRKETFEYSKDNEAPVKLTRKEDEIIQLMNDKRKEIEMFIYSQKLNLRNDIQLVQLFNYYNSLFTAKNN